MSVSRGQRKTFCGVNIIRTLCVSCVIRLIADACLPLQLRDAIAKHAASMDAAELQKILTCESSAPASF